jgi:hypothetical protein
MACFFTGHWRHAARKEQVGVSRLPVYAASVNIHSQEGAVAISLGLQMFASFIAHIHSILLFTTNFNALSSSDAWIHHRSILYTASVKLSN